jgi:hypothetical protein
MKPMVHVLMAGAVAFLPIAGSSQEKLTDNTFKAVPGQPPPAATLADIAWLEGHWSGVALGGLCEEIWSAPVAGSMMGMFRLLVDGAPAFYELELLVEEKGSLVLRVKHFNRDFTGWEDKEKSVDFPLVAKDGRNMHFEGVSFHPRGDDALTIFLAIKTQDGGYREETFAYTRSAIQRGDRSRRASDF